MKKINTILFFLLFIYSFFPQQKEANVTFVIEAPGLPSNSQVYITGNSEKLGMWNPSLVILDFSSTDTVWSRSFSFPLNEKIEFKFTRGTWVTETVNEDGSVPPNNILEVKGDTTLHFILRKWKDQFEQIAQGQSRLNRDRLTGEVEYIRGMKGDGIKPRDIIIWLPPDYETNKDKRYPVLYMHDGQNIFDPKTSMFGADWQIDETADSLIKAGVIKEIIIVGIYNTPDRSKEYANTDTGHIYMNFIINKLKPTIDNKFRTLTDRENTATGGSSLGGLISFMLLWEHPDIFSMAACLSPAFHIEYLNYIPLVENYYGKKKLIKIYIDNGTVGLEERLQPGVDEMIKVLEEKSYEKGNDLYWFLDQAGAHDEKTWAKRFWRALEFMFGK